MTQRVQTVAARGPRAVALVSLAGLALCAALPLAGCDRSSPTSRGVETASRDLLALSAGGTTPAPPESQKKTYTAIAQNLPEVSQSASAGEKAAAMLLTSQAQQGLGHGPAYEAFTFEAASLNKIREIEGALSQWTQRQSAATAADAFDPSAEITDIDTRKAQKDSEITKERARREQIAARLAQLTQAAKAKVDSGEAKIAEYTKRTQDTARMSAREAAPIVEQANVLRRDGETLRLEGLRIQAEADQVVPVLAEVDAIIGQLTNQKATLEKAQTHLRDHHAAAKQESTEARAAANAAAQDLDTLVGELAKMRETELKAAYEQAQKFYSQAVKSAQAAAQVQDRAMLGSAKSAVGGTQLSVAETVWARAQGQRSHALVLERLSKTRPELPKAGSYGEAAKTIREEAKASVEQAVSALDAAKSAFASVPASGTETKERLEALAGLLEKASEAAQGNAMDLAATFKFQPGIGADIAAANAGPEETIGAMLSAIKGGRTADLVEYINLPSPTMKPAVAALLAATTKASKADAACKAKFGKSMAEVLSTAPGMGSMIAGQLASAKEQGLDLDKLATLKTNDFSITVDGTRATATADGLPMPLEFSKVGTKWLYNESSIAAAGPMLAQVGRIMEPMGKLMDEWTTGVEQGTYADEAAAAKDFSTKMMEVMKPLMGGMGG